MIPDIALGKILPFQQEAPVNVELIAEQFDLKIFEQEFSEGISGMLWKNPEFKTPSGFAIIVNKKEPYVRQRFTAAHEIGHFVLHRDLIGDKFEENYMLRSDKMSNRQEVDANQFAADLLMPYHLITKLVDRGIKDVDSLAAALQVSKIAMGIRLGYPT